MNYITEKYIASDIDYVDLFEKELCSVLETTNVLSVSSGTASIITALYSLGVKEGDEIITSPLSPLCTAYPVLHSGGIPVFADLENDSFGLSISSVKERLTPKTKVILEVPMWGYPINAERMRTFAKDNGLYLVFDLAHCLGTKFGGSPLSKYCDIACFSTQKNKIISTGEGGFLATDDKSIFNRAQKFTKMGHLNGIDFGINFKMSAIQADQGLKNLKALGDNLKRRYMNSQRIKSLLDNDHINPFKEMKDSEPSFQRLIVQSYDSSNKLAAYMDKKGIPSDIIQYDAKPLYDFPILKKYKAHCPIAEKLIESITTIPVHYQYSDEDLKYIANMLNQY